MDWFEVFLARAAAKLSAMLQPVVFLLDRLTLLLRSYLDGFGLSYSTQSAVLTTLWMLVAAIVVLSLSGWWRLLAVVCVLLVVAKMYGLLPGA